QDVAWHEADRAVARADEHHAAGHRDAGTVDRSAARLHAVRSFELIERVEVPYHLPAGRVIGAKMSVEAARKPDAGNRGHCLRLSRVAPCAAGARIARR